MIEILNIRQISIGTLLRQMVVLSALWAILRTWYRMEQLELNESLDK